MIKRIVSFSLYQPLFIVLGVALFIGGGIWAFKNLPVEAFPDVTDTQVTVISLFPGRAAEEVEKQITIPLEVGLSGVPGAVRMFSHTQFGLSFIMLTFDDRYSGYFARQQVVERLREVDMPEGAQSELAPFSTAIGEIYRYRMKGDKVSPRELRTYQDWVVSRQLRLVPGVADVVTLGGLVKQYEVRPDTARMRDYKVTLSQLSQAIQRGNANAGGSYVEQGRQQFLIRGIGLFTSPEDIGNVRAAAIVAVTIPLALLATFLGLTFIGIPANLLSLGAMDFGIIVDGAVIVVENIFRKLTTAVHDHEALDDKRRRSLILDAAVEVGRPTLFSMLIIIAAHIPIFTLQRHEGRIFAPMAYSVVSALIGALILSLTLVPLLCAVMLKKNLPEQENFVVRGAKSLYEPALQWALRNRRLVLGTAVVCLALSLALLPQLGTEFLP